VRYAEHVARMEVLNVYKISFAKPQKKRPNTKKT